MKSFLRRITLATAFVCVASATFSGGLLHAQFQQTWVNQRSDTGFTNEWTGFFDTDLGLGNWNPSRANNFGPYTVPGQFANGFLGSGAITDVAFFGNTANTTPTVGINHQSTGGGLTLGGIGFGSNSIAWSIGNSSTAANTAGFLQLRGAALNTATGQLAGGSGSKYIVVSDAQQQNVTIQNSNNGGTQAMTLRLGLGGGEFYVTGGRQLSINVVVQEAAAGFGFSKTGAGTMLLSQNNTISGAVSIAAGTLQVGSGGTTGDFGTTTAGLANDGVLAVNRSNTFTIANAISGTGTVSNLGGGTTILTGNNSYVATNISAGTIQVGNGGTSGTLGSGLVTNNGTLSFNRSDNLTVGNTINGSGQLVKNNSNTLTLTANHGFTGAVSVNSGTFQLGNGGSSGGLAAGGAVTVAGGATLAVNRSDNVSLSAATGGRALTVNGDFRQNGPGALQISAALSVSGTATVASGSLIVDSSLSAAGVQVSGGASLVLGSGGSVAGNVSVASTGSLSGFGSITGNVDMLAGGTLTPGSSPGTLSIAGNLLLGSGTILNFELDENNQTVGAGFNDLITVAGNLTLAGTLNVIGIPGNVFSNTPKTWTLFTYTGTLTDNGLVLGSLPSGQDNWVLDTSNAGQVNLTAVPEPASSLLLGGLAMGAVLVRRRRTEV